MHIKRIDLGWIMVSDLVAAKQFFGVILGLKVISYHEQYKWMELQGAQGGALLGTGCCNTQSPVQPGNNAVMSFTTDNIVAMQTYLKNKGVEVADKILEVPGHVKMLDFKDQDGNHYQIVEDLSDENKNMTEKRTLAQPHSSPYIKRIDIGWVAVTDLARAKEFFVSILGLDVFMYEEQLRWAEFKTPEGVCNIGTALRRKGDNEYIEPGQNAVMTFTIDDMEAMKTHLIKHGVSLLGETAYYSKVVLQYFKDKDGNIFQLVQDLGDMYSK